MCACLRCRPKYTIILEETSTKTDIRISQEQPGMRTGGTRALGERNGSVLRLATPFRWLSEEKYTKATTCCGAVILSETATN